MRHLLITLAALSVAACAGLPGTESASRTAASEQTRLTCARAAGAEAVPVDGAHGQLHSAGHPYYMVAETGRRGVASEYRPVFRDPYFNPADSRFRQQVYHRCLQQRSDLPQG